MKLVVGLSKNSYKPITNTTWVRAWLCKLQKRCTRLAAASDKVYPVLVVEEAELSGENHRPWASNW
jgi:tRNA A22 N-methylase